MREILEQHDIAYEESEDDHEEETCENDSSDEDPYDEEYKRAWRARRQLAEEEYMNSLTPEQREKVEKQNRFLDSSCAQS